MRKADARGCGWREWKLDRLDTVSRGRCVWIEDGVTRNEHEWGFHHLCDEAAGELYASLTRQEAARLLRGAE